MEPMGNEQIKEIIIRELPRIIETDPEVQNLILRLSRQYFADKKETESRFDRLLEEIRREREEFNRKWEEHIRRMDEFQQEQARKWEEQERRWQEQTRKWEEQEKRWQAQTRKWEEQEKRWQEQTRKWEEQEKRWQEQVQKWKEQEKRWQEQVQRWKEQDKKWEENQKVIRQMLKKLEALDRKFDSTIGALGARWGLYTEQSFRNALKGILEEFFDVQVVGVSDYDETGEVFGRPEQIELDLIIKDGVLIICEIKSSMSKADMYLFERKARFYEKRYGKKAHKLIVISPMVNPDAREVAEKLGIEVYSYAEEAGEALSEL